MEEIHALGEELDANFNLAFTDIKTLRGIRVALPLLANVTTEHLWQTIDRQMTTVNAVRQASASIFV